MEKIKRTFFLVLGMAILNVCFTNCGQSFEPMVSSGSNSFASKEVCEDQLRSVFQKTYHPFLSNYCFACHSAAQGSKDVATSYAAFQARGEKLIDYQATHAHGGNNFSSAMQVEIDKFKAGWTAGQDDFQSCLSQNQDGASGVMTLAKTIPNLERTVNNTNDWVTVQWDLENEVEGWAAGRFQTVFKLEARIHRVNGANAGLLIRNPTLKLKNTQSNILVSGMMIYIDNREQRSVTTYSILHKIVAGTDEVKLMELSGSAYAAYPEVSNQTRVSIQFGEMSLTSLPPGAEGPPPTGTPVVVDLPVVPIPAGGVSYAQLTSGTSPYRVFNRSCVGCHNAGSGRLNLNDYDTAKGSTALIIQRMNDSTSPMPPNGLLRQNDRDIVKSWIDAGTPK